MDANVNPRSNGFNYGIGWGPSRKPPIYSQAQQVALMLNKRANEASRKAWELEMAIRSVRLAETEMEELRSVDALETELAKHRQVQLA